MGKKPDQIEQDIRAHRARISQRMEGLQQRVQEDVKTIRSDVSGRASGVVGDATDKLLNPWETLKLEDLKGIVQEHTVSSVAGALGVGVVLGMVSEGFGGGNGRAGGASSNGNRAGHENRENGDGSGMAALLASMLGPAASTAQDELQELVREGFGLVKGQIQQVKDGKSDVGMLVRNRDVGVE